MLLHLCIQRALWLPVQDWIGEGDTEVAILGGRLAQCTGGEGQSGTEAEGMGAALRGVHVLESTGISD